MFKNVLNRSDKKTEVHKKNLAPKLLWLLYFNGTQKVTFLENAFRCSFPCNYKEWRRKLSSIKKGYKRTIKRTFFCVFKERKSYGFGMTWGWVNDEKNDDSQINFFTIPNLCWPDKPGQDNRTAIITDSIISRFMQKT